MQKQLLKIGICHAENPKCYDYLASKFSKINVTTVLLDCKNIEQEKPDDEIEVIYIHPKDAVHLPKYFSLFKNLTWVQGMFAGVDTFIKHKEAFSKQGAVLTNVKGAFAPSLGEFVPAFILYWEKNLGIFKDYQSKKIWKLAPVNMLIGKTCGIVGYGNIGQEVAKRLKFGFNMRVIGLKNRVNIEDGKEFVDELVDKSKLDYLLAESDYVVSILPKTPETDLFFDESKFSKFKKDSIFINIGRGSSVKEDDLIKYLKSKETLRAASLDVTFVEPLPQDSPLWELENCYISNHSADFLNDGLNNQQIAMDIFVDIAAKEFLVDKKIKTNLIDLDLGY